MKKLFIALTAATAALCGAFGFSACENKKDTYNGIEYTLSADKTYYSVSKIGKDVEDAVIESEYKGLPVKAIADNTIVNLQKLKSVIVPEGVTHIGDYSFTYCNNLESISVPDSLKYIGEYTFLSNDLPYKEIDGGYYLGNSQNPCVILLQSEDAKIDNRTKIIYFTAFRYCDNVTEITLPEGVTYIGDEAFSNCANLTSVSIPDSIYYIGESAFSKCENLQFNELDGAQYLGNAANPYTALARVTDTEITNLEISGKTKIILDNACEGCKKLATVSIHNNVTCIGKAAFKDCINIRNINIPDGIMRINNYTFNGCTRLLSINIPASVTSIGDMAFEHCTHIQDINFRGSKTQWDKIEKELNWNYYTDFYTVHCTDGDIAKN